MGKKKILKQSLEFCIKKAEELINFLPKTGAEYIKKADKDYNKLYKKDEDEVTKMKINSICYAYSNPSEPIE